MKGNWGLGGCPWGYWQAIGLWAERAKVRNIRIRQRAQIRAWLTQSQGDDNQGDLFMNANSYWAIFVRYIALASQKVMQSCWQKKRGGGEGEKGGHLSVFCFLCCLNCLKPKEMYTEVDLLMKSGRPCSADHRGVVWMVPSGIHFPGA